MTTRINVQTNNANLKSALPPRERLLAHANLTRWWQAEEEYLTVDPPTGIVSWLPLKGGITATQADTGKRAELVAGAMFDETGALFSETDNDNYPLGSNPTLTGNVSIVTFYKPTGADRDALRGIFGNFTSGTARFGIGLRNLASPNPNAWAYVGNGAVVFDAIMDQVNCSIMVKSSTDLFVRQNGVTGSPASHNDTSGSGAVVIGAVSANQNAFRGYIGDIMVFNTAVTTNAEIMELLTEYAATVYPGVSV